MWDDDDDVYDDDASTTSYISKMIKNKCVRDDPLYARDDDDALLVLLSDVMIHVSIVLVSFHVLAIDQTFDSFLQILVVHRELEFRHDLVD